MTRKRDTIPEALLQQVITGLENDDPPTYRTAVLALLAFGPLLCPATLKKELEHPAKEQWDAGMMRVDSVVRSELLAFLHQTVRYEDTGLTGYGISMHGRITFSANAAGRRVTCTAEGAMRDVVVLQMLLLLDRVGLSNVRLCSAGDCQRLFVKTYRREFCSARCQQRDYKRQLRQRTRAHKEQQKTRARRRRTTKEPQPARVVVTPTTTLQTQSVRIPVTHTTRLIPTTAYVVKQRRTPKEPPVRIPVTTTTRTVPTPHTRVKKGTR